jgi:hypothetical protein
MAFTTLRIFSRLPSVDPTHLLRKFLSLMAVRPDDLAKASATKVLPVPMGPVNNRPIGTRLVFPSRMLLAMFISSVFTPSMPPTTEKSCAGSTNSISPKHSFSRISRLRWASSLNTSS